MKEEKNNNIVPINEELDIAKYETENIKNLIYTIRGKQVMLDSDVARLYHYGTKRINETVRRNKERFPSNFCFQLSETEVENYGGRRTLPYVFTEQGIAMLSGLLRNEIAIKVSIITSVTIHYLLKDTLLNSIGNKEVKKWTKFKRFMSKYTLIEERKTEEMVIYERYIPYSMALNVNKEYKDVWEDIIPKDERKRIMLHYRILECIFLKPFLKFGDKINSYGGYYE